MLVKISTKRSLPLEMSFELTFYLYSYFCEKPILNNSFIFLFEHLAHCKKGDNVIVNSLKQKYYLSWEKQKEILCKRLEKVKTASYKPD